MQSQLSNFHSTLEKLIEENPECKILPSDFSSSVMSEADELLTLLSNSTGRYAWGFIGNIHDKYYALLVIHCPSNEREIITSLRMFNTIWSYEYFKPEQFYSENEFKLCKSIPDAIEALSNMIASYHQKAMYPFIF
ncbi:MAG: hypothetical protein ACERJ1_08140 [Halodesulfovibrio sp.]|uniref:hypothetical protein n=1 Tax=Halodesulfovibrio sp. TaxID=1912772 RepID=UPI00359E472A